MNLHNELLNRVKRTWELLRPGSQAHKPSRSADKLIKQNLPPLMGRRDAAYDRAALLALDEGLFSHDENWRHDHYEKIQRLLHVACEDTKSILQTLSSPDTAAREKHLFDLILLLESIVCVLDDFSHIGSKVLAEDMASFRHFGIRHTDNERIRSERLLSEVEISSVSQLRNYFNRAMPKVMRYREYTAKSFSKPYAARYQKAYDYYQGEFLEDSDEKSAVAE